MKRFFRRRAFLQDFLAVTHANLLPALGLQSVAAALLWSYYFWPVAHHALNHVAVWKDNSGYWFAFFSSALAGGLLPFRLQSWQRGDHRRITRQALPFLALTWGLRGCLVDAFYQLQALLWGDNAAPLTVLIKILFDLGVFSPLIATPFIVVTFAAIDCDFDGARIHATFSGGVLAWWMREVWPLLRLAWLVWLPALAAIYALPSGLQFPTQVIIQCLWSLILVVITARSPTAAKALS